VTNAATPTDFFLRLDESAREVRRIEEQALRDLGQHNIESYRDGMRSKAELLAGLPAAFAPLLRTLPEDAAQAVRDGLRSFAHSAGNALSLNSVFYMSALLYPEDYREGEPNDLEVFAEELRARFPTP